MRALVSGGAGFIGSHLCERLLQEGYEVVCIDNLITGRHVNVAHLMGNERFSFIEHDIVEPHPLIPHVDRIYHFASPASPVAYQRYPIATLSVNSRGTHHLLDLAARDGARLLFASTSEVYGDPLQHPQREDYFGNVNPIGPRSIYDEAKRYGEALTMAYGEAAGIDTRIVRIFNTYGPRMDADDGRVVANFVVQALRGEPLTVYGDGSQTRSFQYVDDLVEGVFRLMESTYRAPVNIGNPAEFTMLELAELVRKLTDTTSIIQFRPLPADDPKQRRPDISLAMKIIGWQPSVPLETGLKRTIAYFRAALAKEMSASNGHLTGVFRSGSPIGYPAPNEPFTRPSRR
jgi:dTDP-glucose 4,6-dehydratase